MPEHTQRNRRGASLLAGLALVGLTIPATGGCNRQMLEATVGVISLVAATAELVSTVSALANSHSHHMHGAGCGHQWARADGRDVYFADGYWEFYDAHQGIWYVYPDGLPEY